MTGLLSMMPSEEAMQLPVVGGAVRSVRRLLDDHGASLTGRDVLALCSGGIDSVVMTTVIGMLPRGSRPRSVTALWCDHGLRPTWETEAERAAAQAAADGVGAELITRRAGPSDGLAHSGGNLQARARAWRYQTAAAVATERGIEDIVTGHTASDQLEGVLYGLVADSGDHGIGGMSVVAPVPVPDRANQRLIRPLLALTRSEVSVLATTLGVDWQEDPTNQHTDRYVRNHIRRNVVPELLASHPGAGANIARRAQRGRVQAEVMRELAEAAAVRATGADGSCIDVRNIRVYSTDACCEIIASWLRMQGAGRALSGRVVIGVVEQLAQPVESYSGEVSLTGGACVRRDGYYLTFHPAEQ